MDYISNPKKKIDPLIVQLLTENPQNQYNLVCNVLLEVVECNDTDKLNDIAILCCELTAQCPPLASEWLGAMFALCCDSADSMTADTGPFGSYLDLHTRISLADPAIYSRLGIFVSILTARHCFQLHAFGMKVHTYANSTSVPKKIVHSTANAFFRLRHFQPNGVLSIPK